MGKNALTSEHLGPFLEGVKAGLPVAMGYIPIAIAFGLLAKSNGVPIAISVSMSLFIFAGASQFVGVSLLTAGAAYWEIITATFLLNLRHFLMSASLSPRLAAHTPKRRLAILAYGLTDETFSVASLRPEKTLSFPFILGLNLIAFSAWNVGTWAGFILGTGLPGSVRSSMGIALYAMFLGLLIPAAKNSHPALVVVLLAGGIHALLQSLPRLASFSSSWGIVISTVLAAAIGALLFPEEGKAV